MTWVKQIMQRQACHPGIFFGCHTMHLFAVFLLFFPFPNSATADENSSTSPRKQIAFALFDDLSTKNQRFTNELIPTIFEPAGYKVHLLPASMSRAISMIRSGQVKGYFYIAATENLFPGTLLSEQPINEVAILAVSYDLNKLRYFSDPDAKGIRVATDRGIRTNLLNTNAPHTVIYLPSLQRRMMLMKAGRVDIVVGRSTEITTRLAEIVQPKKQLHYLRLGPKWPIHVVFPDTPDGLKIKKLYDSWLSSALEKGTLAAMMKRHAIVRGVPKAINDQNK